MIELWIVITIKMWASRSRKTEKSLPFIGRIRSFQSCLPIYSGVVPRVIGHMPPSPPLPHGHLGTPDPSRPVQTCSLWRGPHPWTCWQADSGPSTKRSSCTTNISFVVNVPGFVTRAANSHKYRVVDLVHVIALWNSESRPCGTFIGCQVSDITDSSGQM